jgi:hypothetical protein
VGAGGNFSPESIGKIAGKRALSQRSQLTFHLIDQIAACGWYGGGQSLCRQPKQNLDLRQLWRGDLFNGSWRQSFDQLGL